MWIEKKIFKTLARRIFAWPFMLLAWVGISVMFLVFRIEVGSKWREFCADSWQLYWTGKL